MKDLGKLKAAHQFIRQWRRHRRGPPVERVAMLERIWMILKGCEFWTGLITGITGTILLRAVRSGSAAAAVVPTGKAVKKAATRSSNAQGEETKMVDNHDNPIR